MEEVILGLHFKIVAGGALPTSWTTDCKENQRSADFRGPWRHPLECSHFVKDLNWRPEV